VKIIIDFGSCYTTKTMLKGDFTMWVITVFEKKDVRIFEFTNKGEATKALEGFKKNAILSFTK